MDLSLIIPCYNTGNYIHKLIKSIKSQCTTYEFETIFVLNNCTDATEEIIKNSKIDCTILNCEEQGCGLARNMGFEASKGTYIWFLDSDDWIVEPDAIQTLLTFLFSSKELIVRMNYQSTFVHYYSMVWQYVYNRKLIHDIKFRKEQPAEDDVFMDKVLDRLGYSKDTYKKLPYIDRKLYYYNYMRDGSNMFRVRNGEKI